MLKYMTFKQDNIISLICAVKLCFIIKLDMYNLTTQAIRIVRFITCVFYVACKLFHKNGCGPLSKKVGHIWVLLCKLCANTYTLKCLAVLWE